MGSIFSCLTDCLEDEDDAIYKVLNSLEIYNISNNKKYV